MQNKSGGQRIYLLPSSRISPEDRQKLEKMAVNRGMTIHILHADEAGISIQINRMGSDIRGFIPRSGVGLSNFDSFFEVGATNNPSYNEGRHVTAIFPTDFV